MPLSQYQIAGSDDWWAMRLTAKLGASFPRLFKLRRYRNGDAPLPEELDPQIRQAFAQFISMAKLNFAEQLVVSTVSRETPVGFRTAAPSDSLGDPLAIALWEANQGPTQFADMLDAKATYGHAFMVELGRVQPTDVFPTTLIADPWTMESERNRLKPWLQDAAVLVGHDPILGVDMFTLMRPGYFRTAYKPVERTMFPNDGTVWQPSADDWTWMTGPVPYGFTLDVPVSRFETRGDVGEFELHLGTLDRINKTILDRLTITAMQAFRQKAISPDKEDTEGMPEFYPEGHPQAGQRINYDDEFKAGPNALWLLPRGATMWESAVTDIRPILEAVSNDLKHLAAASSTPIYVLSPDAANGSATGAALARETNILKVRDRVKRDTVPLKQLMAWAFAALGDALRADVHQLSVMWGPTDYSTLVERAEAARGYRQGGMSRRFIAERVEGMTPAELAQEEQNWQDDAFTAALAASA